MNWITLLIPLIVLIVWILSNLARQEEPPRRGGTRVRRPIPGGRTHEPVRPSRSADEVDRFLASLRQKRQQEQTQQQDPTHAPPPIAARPPTPAPPPIPTRGATSPPKLDRRTPAPLPTSVDLAGRNLNLESLPSLPKVGLQAHALGPSAQPSEAAKKLIEMFRDAQTLQTAILMREVLAPPVAKRAGSLPLRRS